MENMKNGVVLSLLGAALIVLPALAHADHDSRFNLLLSYKLANGQGVAIAMPGNWEELSKTRALEPGAAVRFLDESGRPVEVPAAVLEQAAATRSIVWSKEHAEPGAAARAKAPRRTRSSGA
jgi:hypothetical protein